MGTRPTSGVAFVVAPRDTFNGLGVGRKTDFEVGEAIRWGLLFHGKRLRNTTFLFLHSAMASVWWR